MFGRKSSMNANEKFVMAMGQKAGNLPKQIKAPSQTVKAAKAAKANPLKATTASKIGSGKMSVMENANRMSPGTVNTFKTQGKK